MQSLSIGSTQPHPAGADLLRNPLDLCRTTLAELLSELTQCEVQVAYNSIQWPNNIFNGDLSVTIPKLCPGRKPAEASAHLVDTVRITLTEHTMRTVTERTVSQRTSSL